MMCVLTWCEEFVPSNTSKHKLRVYSKLNGVLLGHVDKPEVLPDKYHTVRNLQDQIAGFFKHACRPPKYIVLFVGSTRLTKPSFMFDNQVEESTPSLLSETSRVDVMYEADDSFALDKLRYEGLTCTESDHIVTIESNFYHTTGKVLMPEMQVFGFRNITDVVFTYGASNFGNTDYFHFVQHFSLHLFSCLDKYLPGLLSLPNLNSLTLSINRHCAFKRFVYSSLDRVGMLTQLEHLKLDYIRFDSSTRHTPETFPESHLPSSLGLLTNLKELSLSGHVHGSIPTELGQLHRLEVLTIKHTQLSSNLPSELGRLSCLQTLDVSNNNQLEGKLPKELNNIKTLQEIYLCFTNVSHAGVMTHGSWNDNIWSCKYAL
jgi:Leucine-rich repeat (LRR) protein